MEICFIINPISGTRKKETLPGIIRNGLDATRFEPQFVFTERQGHAHELARREVEKGTPFVVAVGGDGTVNEIAAALRDSNTALGIIPSGSGNGLARHLHIPLHLDKALKTINAAHVKDIDYGLVNGQPFFCTLGSGFDAHVSDLFAHSSRRGFRKYASIIAQEFIMYRSQYYRLVIDGKPVETKAMLVTVANASQYGNNGYISPLADISDGELDVCILLPFPKLLAATLAVRLISKTIHRSPYYRGFKGKEIIIERTKADKVHLDGDPFKMDKVLNISIIPNGLKVMVNVEKRIKFS
ncbi:MAG: diacylglycerol kinase family lipid kinase [Bacteroidales bacterium]|jgi:YegS/Rv2252/BmrU family lipid kinase|nr:diacylglycerol kinase family lipid kinase [Bacteroidales bacterium]